MDVLCETCGGSGVVSRTGVSWEQGLSAKCRHLEPAEPRTSHAVLYGCPRMAEAIAKAADAGMAKQSYNPTR
jgi:hypothetical protein